MRTVNFEIHGAVGGWSGMEAELDEFLRSIPNLLTSKLVPPIDVLNDLLSRGVKDAGVSGGCRWVPFQISPEDWRQLLAKLESEQSRYVESPSWVRGFDDWDSWVMEYRFGVPGQELNELLRRSKEFERQRDEALKSGNQTLVEELHLKVIDAGNQVVQFIKKYRRA